MSGYTNLIFIKSDNLLVNQLFKRSSEPRKINEEEKQFCFSHQNYESLIWGKYENLIVISNRFIVENLISERATELENKILSLSNSFFVVDYTMMDEKVSFLYRDHCIRRVVCDKFSIGDILPEETDIPNNVEDWMTSHRYKVASKIAERVTKINPFTILNKFELEIFDNFLQ